VNTVNTPTDNDTEEVPWYAFHDNLASLWTWLDEHGHTPGDGPAYFMEKPWKWNLEYDAYLAFVMKKPPLNSTTEDVHDFLHSIGLV